MNRLAQMSRRHARVRNGQIRPNQSKSNQGAFETIGKIGPIGRMGQIGGMLGG
jgi:hypothetical protein